MQQNPNPNPDLSSLTTNNYSYSVNSNPPQPTTIDPHGALHLNQPRPPGIDPPYVPPPVAVQYMQLPISYEPQQGVAATPAAYYQQDPNAASATAYYQDPNASWLAAYYAAGVSTSNPTIQPQRRNNKLKGPMKTTIAQSSWCEVCKICCNSKDVLNNHKAGKKHMRNLEKLKEKFTAAATVVAPAPLPALTPAPTDKPTIGPEENPTKLNLTNSQKQRRRASSARAEDLETKRRRVLEGGAAAQTVRACHICNVVCNSDTVFSFHLAGQKHASMVKKHALGAAVAPAI
ncbi:hypothetical protein PHJA_002288000 [Phtheirospermum japonicum]|uniref:U1-type domain-containing protein n=1 Tax=Phtheirospermum japonicum TaxID=374723 RepID=A0A830CNQ2_9LAMI|nr:hypothetical protein PHJA_002288000 [Phtheirospermum japonicum]